MISGMMTLATAAPNGALIFTQTTQTISIVMGILVTMGMMLIFVYKNRTLGLENTRAIARIEADYRERVRAIETSSAERMALIETQQRAQDTELVKLQIKFATLSGQLGVN